MATSTAPALKAALLTALVTALTVDGTQVVYSHPGDALEPEAVFLGDVRGTSEVPTSRAGRLARHERYTLDVWISVVADGATAEAAETRAYALLAKLEDVLADTATLGLAIVAAVLGEWDASLAFDDARRGWSALLRVGVDVNARLS